MSKKMFPMYVIYGSILFMKLIVVFTDILIGTINIFLRYALVNSTKPWANILFAPTKALESSQVDS